MLQIERAAAGQPVRQNLRLLEQGFGFIKALQFQGCQAPVISGKVMQCMPVGNPLQCEERGLILTRVEGCHPEFIGCVRFKCGGLDLAEKSPCLGHAVQLEKSSRQHFLVGLVGRIFSQNLVEGDERVTVFGGIKKLHPS